MGGRDLLDIEASTRGLERARLELLGPEEALDAVDLDAAAPRDEDAGLESLLEFLHRSRGLDFEGYKRASLARRIRRRMSMVGIETFEQYLDHLEVHPDEFPQLFNLILINVTGFFRDPGAWEALSDRLAEVIDVRGDLPIRVWSAGCSSGEEPYSLAMMLAERLGIADFRRRVKVYATDIDEEALAHARLASYARDTLASVPPALVERYFAPAGSAMVVDEELRRSVVFGRHDLVQDAPISKIDILTCRNALMYFNAETQRRILERLRFSLNPSGLLLLGKAEMLPSQAELFTAVDLKSRLFRRVARGLPRARDGATRGPSDARLRLHGPAFDASPSPKIVIDDQGLVSSVNASAFARFGLPPDRVIGRPFRDLELAHRPPELRTHIESVRRERRTVILDGVEHVGLGGERAVIDIAISALVAGGAVAGTLLTFTDATRRHRLESDLLRADGDLETARRELRTTREELETTSEELQSVVEELETTNEELQATNEELATMNEELQSTNEELQTINAELRQRGIELNEASALHGAVLASFRLGVVVLDESLTVRGWNPEMEALGGLRESEARGRRFFDIGGSFPAAELRETVHACLTAGAESETELRFESHRGGSVVCRVRIAPLERHDQRGVVVIVEEVKSK